MNSNYNFQPYAVFSIKSLLILIFYTISIFSLSSQNILYTSFNGHSHNDYLQSQPFNTAFEAQMGSIEADVFLYRDQLYVAHTFFQINTDCTFSDLYIQPIVYAVRSCQAYPMQLMIDVKTGSQSTLNEIIRQLSRYPDVFNENSPIKVIISGNRPDPSVWNTYPSYILFDGRPSEHYTPDQWHRIGLVSDNISNYTSLFSSEISPKCYYKIKKVVDWVHEKGKKIRFWRTYDTEWTWQSLMSLGVDYINTDFPKTFKHFIERKTIYAVNAN